MLSRLIAAVGLSGVAQNPSRALRGASGDGLRQLLTELPLCGLQARLARERRTTRRCDCHGWLRRPDSSLLCLPDLRCQLVIRRLQLGPTRLGVAALAASEVSGEVFHVDLDPGPVGGNPVDLHPSFLPD
jgi:hypothetical protein